MRPYFQTVITLIFPLLTSGNAAAECKAADLKYLQTAGYSVAEAVEWCKGIAPPAIQPSAATVTAAESASKPVKADKLAATSGPQAAAAERNEQTGTTDKPADPPSSVVSKAGQSGGTAGTPTEDKGISPTASAFLKGWGVGLAYIKNRSPIVSDAVIINGVVRASSIQNYQTELIFGSHWYFQGAGKTECGLFLGKRLQSAGCLGIFLGVGVGGSNSASQLIDFVGTGLLWGFGDVVKANGETDPQAKKHSIGIGIGRRFNVKHLGEGFVPNQAPPAGETQIRYDTRDTLAPYLFYTYNF